MTTGLVNEYRLEDQRRPKGWDVLESQMWIEFLLMWLSDGGVPG